MDRSRNDDAGPARSARTSDRDGHGHLREVVLIDGGGRIERPRRHCAACLLNFEKYGYLIFFFFFMPLVIEPPDPVEVFPMAVPAPCWAVVG